MATKAQIARRLYKKSLTLLSPGQKARVTREYNAQDQEMYASTPARVGTVSVSFARPSVIAVAKGRLSADSTVGDALKQLSINLNPKKEGIVDKETGDIVMFADVITKDAIYVITPGVDSSE